MKKNYLKFLFSTLVIAMFAIILASCCSCNNIPVNFTVEIGSGGGFTGMWSGFTLEANGQVKSWNGKMQGENPKEYQALKNDKMRQIHGKIKSSKILDLHLQEPGNMTKYLKITLDGKQNILLWDYSRNDSLTKNLNEVFDYILTTLETKD